MMYSARKSVGETDKQTHSSSVVSTMPVGALGRDISPSLGIGSLSKKNLVSMQGPQVNLKDNFILWAFAEKLF